MIENAIGGHGNDRINGNQANNQFTGGAGADTFVFAIYSGKIANPTGEKTVTDTSIDSIMDFKSGTDKMDLSWYAKKYGINDPDVLFDAKTDTLTIDTDNDGQFDDVKIMVYGSDVQSGDYVF